MILTRISIEFSPALFYTNVNKCSCFLFQITTKSDVPRFMHMTQIQSVLNEKKITFSYTEEDNCGSIDFEHRGLRYHIWEFADDVEPVGVETNLRYAGRDEEIEGDYDTILAEHLKKEF